MNVTPEVLEGIGKTENDLAAAYVLAQSKFEGWTRKSWLRVGYE